MAPLFDGIGINVALVSYDGRLFWGLNADAARVVDLADFRSDLERALDEIVNAPATRSRAARDRKRSIAGESR